jgi:uncharacterized protein involved in outer membrane biogenesis
MWQSAAMHLGRHQTMILALLGGGIAVLLIMSQLLTKIIDTDAAIEPLRRYAQELTGQPLIVEDVSVGGLSGPRITIDGMAIRNVTNAQQPYLIYADKMTIELSWMALFQDKPEAKGLSIDGLKLYLETGKKGQKNWRFLGKMKQKVEQIYSLDVMLSNAQLRYVDLQKNDRFTLEAINGRIGLGFTGVEAQLQAQLMGQRVGVNGDCQFAHFVHLNSFDARCKGGMQGDGLVLGADYRLLQSNQGMQMRGTLNVDTQDMRVWGDAFFSQDAKLLEEYIAEPLPLAAQIDTYQDASQAIVNVTHLTMGRTVGRGSVSLKRSAQQGLSGAPKVNVNAVFERIDFDTLKRLVRPSSAVNVELLSQNGLVSPEIEGTLRVTATQVLYNDLVISGVKTVGRFERGHVVVSQAQGAVAGEGTFTSIGRFVGTAQGIQYEGGVEASGKDLSALLPLVGAENTFAMKQSLTDYRARMSALIGPRETTLSDVRLIVGDDLRVSGGITMNKEDKARVTGNLSIENLDMQPFWHVWLDGANLNKPPPAGRHPLKFDWLPDLASDVNVQLHISNTLFPDARKGSVSGRLTMEAGRLSLRQMNAKLADQQISGEVTLTRDSQQPRARLEAKLAFSDLALGNWLRESIWRKQNDSDEGGVPSVWSKQPFNMNSLKYFDGSAQLRVSQLSHDAFNAQDVQLQAALDGSVLNISSWKMKLWSGLFSATAKLDASVLPTFSLQYRHDNAAVRPIMQAFFERGSVGGTATLAHNMTTSGVNFHEWINNLQGGIRFAVTNLSVEQFNLLRLTQLISSARSVSELPNIMRQVLAGGTAVMPEFKGAVFYEDGKLKTTAISFAATGVTGLSQITLDLLNWRMKSTFRYRFTGLNAVSTPVLDILFSGPCERLKRELNVKSLEAFFGGKWR